jgi:multicomponent K+:H+ antiporter subunit E
MEIRKWLPRPRLSLFLWVLWLFLMNTLSVGHILLGGFLAWLIPYSTQQFWPEQARLQHPWRMLSYIGMVLREILIANLVVARLILGREEKLNPAFVSVPLDLENKFAITILASTITLTPGTVSASISADSRTLLIHALNVDDEAALIADIKARFEAPLKEMFPC